MSPVKQKVDCFITRAYAGITQVLVFEHIDFPDAGIQVPAGSVEPGEAIEQAALREAWEESGIKGLRIERYAGAFKNYWRDRHEEQERHVFHLSAPLPLPGRWEHTVSAGAEDKGLRFVYYWMDVVEAVRKLNSLQSGYLQRLLTQ